MTTQLANADSRLKGSLKHALQMLARNNLLWNAVWLPLAKFARHMTWQRSVKELHRIEAELHPSYVVQGGLFAGMRYPRFKSVGSALLAKLLGTYEVELTEILTQAIQTPYEVIADVGCAEGYYAVGLALKIPQCKVFAFDIDPEARALCTEMAQVNHVTDRLVVEGKSTGESLSNLVAGKRALVISDCEGGELDLFDPSTILKIAHCDVLIEAHEFIHRGISQELQNRFRATHECRVVHSMDPLEKAERHPSPLIREKSTEVLAWLYSEGRPEVMEWLWLTPRSSGGARV
jgi:hypothetical protein